VSYRGAKYLATISAVIVAVAMSATPLQGAQTENIATVDEADKGQPRVVHIVPIASIPQKPKVNVPKIKVHREYRAAKSKDAKDLHGFEPSLYRGKWYTPKHERERQCIMKRESNFSYRAANKTSSARGAYQFLDNSWRNGLVHMFVKESKKTKDGLVEEARSLRNKPIHKWSRYWQDRAFFTAWRFGEGRHHWYHGYKRCY